MHTKSERRARVQRGAGDVPVERRSEEQMADRHAVAAGEDERQREEKKMRNIHVGKRGSETANEEDPDNVRKTVRFEQEALNSSSS